MVIKYANEIIKEVEERGEIQVPYGCVTGEEFEKWLRNRDVNLTRKEIAVAENSSEAYHGRIYEGYYKGKNQWNKTLYLCVENCAVDSNGWVYCKALIPLQYDLEDVRLIQIILEGLMV